MAATTRSGDIATRATTVATTAASRITDPYDQQRKKVPALDNSKEASQAGLTS